MKRYNWPKLLKLSGYLVVLFLLVAYKSDRINAAFFVGAGTLGYLSVFGVVHAALAVVRRQRICHSTAAVVAITLLGDSCVVYLGHGVVLALCTATFLFIDALALGFSGPPVGLSSLEL